MSQAAQRRNKLRSQLKKQGHDSILVTDVRNVSYLTGFSGDSSYLFITAKNAVIISDFRYLQEIADECSDIDSVIRSSTESMIKSSAKQIRKSRVNNVALEGDSLPLAIAEAIDTEMPKVDFVTTSSIVEKLREIKSRSEVALIRKAVYAAQRAFGVITSSLTKDQTEKEIAFNLEHQIRQFGGRGTSFDPIVAVGSQAALPHATPGNQTIADADFVLCDWGADYDCYLSDITRTMVTGKVTAKYRKVYNTVLQAQQRAIKRIKPGAIMSKIDAAARGHIANAGYGKYFGHSLGHGIGTYIHESPRLAANQHVPLQQGMVVTVEPGIYLPGWGGVRIEDDVLVTRNGHEVLTTLPKKLEECILEV